MDDAWQHIQRRKAEINRAQAELDDELERLKIAEAIIADATGTKGKMGQISLKGMLIEILKEKNEAGEEGASLGKIDELLQARTDRNISKRYISVALAQMKRKGTVKREENIWSLASRISEVE